MLNNTFDTFVQNMNRIYTFNVKYKNQSAFMKFLGVLLFFNSGFMKSYVTTIGSTIYFPSEEFINNNPNSAIGILAHELVHVQQAGRYGKIPFSILYLFPQCLVVFAFLSPLSLWFLLFLLCLAPIPAPWRMSFEAEGYTMSLFVKYISLRKANKTTAEIRESLVESAENISSRYFVGSDYWFMWPFGVSAKLGNNIVGIMNGDILADDEIYSCVSQSLRNME